LVSKPAAVPAALPLGLLEAIRNLDTPVVEDGLELTAQDAAFRRLGLSSTLAAQIARYRQAAERQATVTDDELVSVLRLAGRRSDAGLVFADAGRRAARYALRSGGGSGQTLARLFGRRLANRAVRRLLARYFRGEFVSKGPVPEVRMAQPLSVTATPDGGACAFYGAAYLEVLRQLTKFEGTMAHERCVGRGDATCVWRAERADKYE
jgi:hypothetical protein